MPAGPLNQRVAFTRPTRTDDGAGGVDIASVLQFTVWGQLIPERGKEALEAGRVQSSSMATIRVRSSSLTRQIDTDWTAVIAGASYQIRSIANIDQRREYLDLVAELGVAT